MCLNMAASIITTSKKINCKIINENVLSFEILNNFVLSRLTKTKKGIGLINTMKQLKLIFKDQYIF